ncbi:MAG: M28 family peptidase [Chitinophagaceae bacterium]
MRLIIFLFIFNSTFCLAQCSQDALKNHILQLAKNRPYADSSIQTSLLKNANYIYKELSTFSTKVDYQKFEFHGYTYQNVLCSFGKETAPRIIIGAHYDVDPKESNLLENYSGIAALIELARMLHKVEKQLPIRIDLVAYSLGTHSIYQHELSGSAVHAKSVSTADQHIQGLIEIDGIGLFSSKRKSQQYPSMHYKLMYGTKANFIAIIQNPDNGLWARATRYKLKQYADGLRCINFKPLVPFEYFNDGNFLNYQSYQIPSLKISTASQYRKKVISSWNEKEFYLHLDYSKMAKVVNMLYKTITNFKT